MNSRLQILRQPATLFALGAMVLTTSASAQVTDIKVVSQPAPADLVPGHIVNDIAIDFLGQYHGSEMIVTLESGGLFQHPIGSALPPVAPIPVGVPARFFDTFVAQGIATTDATPVQTPELSGGAVSLGGAPTAQFDAEGINQAWRPPGGILIFDQSDFLVARLTLSTDANGTILYRGHAGAIAPADQIVLDAPIVGGVIVGVAIPEPSPSVLLAIGMVGLAAVRIHKEPK